MQISKDYNFSFKLQNGMVPFTGLVVIEYSIQLQAKLQAKDQANW